jgi:hypothetical protein
MMTTLIDATNNTINAANLIDVNSTVWTFALDLDLGLGLDLLSDIRNEPPIVNTRAILSLLDLGNHPMDQYQTLVRQTRL